MSLIGEVKTKDGVLEVHYDREPCDPREEFDNAGKIITFHPRYMIGDEHNYSNHKEFLAELCREYAYEQFESKISGKFEIRFEDELWRAFFNGEELFSSMLLEDLVDNILDEIEAQLYEPPLIVDELIGVLHDAGVTILPIYMYDHSGITISTGAFSCPWDSGQIGWAYMPKEKENEALNTNPSFDAIKLLKGEVEELDQYLRGEIYGYIKSDNEGNITHSCWGFYNKEDLILELTTFHNVDKKELEELF